MGLSAVRVAARGRFALLGAWPIAGQAEPSLIAPATEAPSDRLLEVAMSAVSSARSTDLGWLSDRSRDRIPCIWPGEHYKLLAGVVSVLRPKTIVEIGTATGTSALAMKSAMPEDGKITTFDLLTWRDHPSAVLLEDDFADGRLEQRSDDLSTPAGWRANADVLQRADLIFVDAKHDGHQEREFLRGFDEVGLLNAPLVVFDDIRVWGMLGFWREIERPKLDLTSFGHWSGTGMVDYS